MVNLIIDKMPNKNIFHAVLVKFWRAFLLFLFSSSFLPIYGSKNNCEVRYDQHHQHGGGGSEGNTLFCSVQTMKENFRVTNLSLSFESFNKVTIRCKKENFHQSFITRETFSDLGRIFNLNVFHCKIGELKDGVFDKVRYLKSLSLNNEWKGQPLTISSSIFRPLKSLEILDLSSNDIWEIPLGIFCPLPNLKTLNISVNHLHDLSQLGFTGSPLATKEKDSSACHSGLVTLDISFNDADTVTSGSLKGLHRLQELILRSNNLGKLDDNAFEGLGSLSSLDLSHNRLVALPENAFTHTPNLMYLYVRNNSLSVLAPELFRGLEYLVKLDLSHNGLKSEMIAESSFRELIRLIVLDLSHNQLTDIKPEFFRDMYSVQELKLSHNFITSLPASSFQSCVNLHTLHLSYNEIQQILPKTFDGVDVLSFLALDNNKLTNLHENAFINLKSLEDLNLNGNLLSFVPKAISHLQSLKALDLGDNQITKLDDLPVKGLDLLYGLRLVNNSISGNISRDTFVNIPSLKILNLAKNRIERIEPGAFVKNQNLQAVRLDANSLNSMNGLFELLPRLEWLNVSDNSIHFFDYHFIPKSLIWLDLHRNIIPSLDNSLGRHDLSLQTLDASFNRLTNISSIQIPKNIQFAFLNDNQISMVEQYTFLNKENLSRVDLFSNKLSRMDMQALRLIPVPADKPLPQFFLGRNSFICDCHMEWLQRFNHPNHDRHYPTIMDLDSIFCQMPFNRGPTFIPLTEVKPSEFLCRYETHCFTLCHCCEFDACDCEMTCPEGCSCFHDQSWRSNIVNCSSHDLLTVPDTIPMDSTEVYLDGNVFRNLSSHAFIGRKHMQILFVNSSKVEILDNGTFSGLTRLKELHLDNNYLEILHGHEFKFLTPLRKLYLHKNRIHSIHKHTFVDMSHLEVLTLHENKLISFPVWRMVDNPYLMQISLSDNQWSCECQFFESFEIWLQDNVRKVTDSDRIKCGSPKDPSSDAYVFDSNSTNCVNSSSVSTVVQPMMLHNLLHPVIAISVAFVVALILLICFFTRHTLKVWFFARYGVRLCQSSQSVPDDDDRDKVFDAFVSYSSKDEAWVNQVLAAQLERTEKPHRLCLHYRDFPVTAYVSDTMTEAVDCSRRTIVVLSRNFIENEWCRFQFKNAHHEVLKKKRPVIVVVLGEIPSGDLDPDLRLYLKAHTVIRSNDKWFWQKLRYAMPDPDIGHLHHRALHTYSTIPERPAASLKYSVNGPSASLHRAHMRPVDPYWA